MTHPNAWPCHHQHQGTQTDSAQKLHKSSHFINTKPHSIFNTTKKYKKEEKSNKKQITYILSLLTPITISGKVFSILPNNKEKNIQKPKNNITNKITQNKTKNSPKTKAKTLEYKTIDITCNYP
jgi:hypothetical protein